MMRRRMIGWMAIVCTELKNMHQLVKKSSWRSNQMLNQMAEMMRRTMMMEQNWAYQPCCRRRWLHSCATLQYLSVEGCEKLQSDMELIQWRMKGHCMMIMRTWCWMPAV